MSQEKKNPQGILLILSGPSGAGKGTICNKLLEKREDLSYSVSCTTRAPRKGEVDGVNYFFVSREKFEDMIKNDELIEYAEVYGNYYGTPRSYVLNQVQRGKDVVLEIDPQGALQIKEHFSDAVFVFIVPPSLKELSARIYKRGTDKESVIKKRLSAATDELKYASKYDYIVVNDDVEKATRKVDNIINAERNRVVRTFFVVDAICNEHQENL
jgi:guanylate kinase